MRAATFTGFHENPREEAAPAVNERARLDALLRESIYQAGIRQLQTEQKQAAAFRKELSEVQAANKKLESARAEAIAAKEKHEKAAHAAIIVSL